MSYLSVQVKDPREETRTRYDKQKSEPSRWLKYLSKVGYDALAAEILMGQWSHIQNFAIRNEYTVNKQTRFGNNSKARTGTFLYNIDGTFILFWSRGLLTRHYNV